MKIWKSFPASSSVAPVPPPLPPTYIYIYLCSGYNPFSQDSRNMLNNVPPAQFSVIETNLLESLSSLLGWVESYYLQDLVPPSPLMKFPWLPPNSLFSLLYFCSILSIVQELYLSHCILVVFTDVDSLDFLLILLSSKEEREIKENSGFLQETVVLLMESQKLIEAIFFEVHG